MGKELAIQLINIANLNIGRDKVQQQFIERSQNERLTRDEGELTHLAVFVMAIDIDTKKVYVGHHKKSGRWIPHGGHVNEGELVEEALEREIWEEWEMKLKAKDIGKPELVTITEIENPNQWKVCKTHYDIWYFVSVKESEFVIDPEILHDEFYEAKWVDLSEARILVGNTPSVQEALELVETKYFIQ